jgi:hypothetical protein
MAKIGTWVNFALVALTFPALALAGQPLETESARLPAARQMVVEELSSSRLHPKARNLRYRWRLNMDYPRVLL